MTTAVPATTGFNGKLTLGHVLELTGIDLSDVVVVRHTYTVGGLETAADLTSANVLKYTRRQAITNRLGRHPPGLWLVFMADGARRSRLLVAYENHGEVVAERTEVWRSFDLQPSNPLSALVGRLVVEWSRDAVNWAKNAASASSFPVVEIADPETVPFPGFDRVLVGHDELRDVVGDSRYAAWRTALGRTRRQHRSAAAGRLGPRPCAAFPVQHPSYLWPSAPTAELDEAESHFKRALLTREYGLNRN